MKGIVNTYNQTSLIIRIIIGLVIGALAGLFCPGITWLGTLGNLFVGALKAIAPVLVFALVVSALAQGRSKMDRRFGLVIFLYMLSTLLASVTAVVGSFLFPQTLILAQSAEAEAIPTGIGEVMNNLLMNMVANPIGSLVEGRYIGILFWAVILGFAMKKIGADSTKRFLLDAADVVSQAVRWIINLAPFGIMGLVFSSVSSNGLTIFTAYGKLLLLLVGCMLVVALVVDPLIAFIFLRKNPYPLVWRCLLKSGLTAFFTRSSAANIPVNMSLSKAWAWIRKCILSPFPWEPPSTWMAPPSQLPVMTLAAANTVGVAVDLPSALILSFLSTLAACGASGVAGGSLLLIPMACSMFGISQDIAMQVVAVGFIIGVVQDSLETALNSAGDVMFAATAEYTQWKKEGRDLPYFLGGNKKLDV